MVKNVILFLSIVIGSGIMIVNVYTSIVDATSWGSNIPESLETARKYFQIVNPGTFFRAISPVNQLLAVLALALFWKSVPSVRKYLGLAVVFYVITDLFTFGFFYPRNAIMFGATTDVEAMKQAWSQWNSMNWLRTLIIGTGLFFSMLSLHKIYSAKEA